MGNYTVKGIPENVMEGLRQRAAIHRRSLNSEIIVALETLVSARRRIDPVRFTEEVRELRARMGDVKPMTPEEMNAAIEEGRA